MTTTNLPRLGEMTIEGIPPFTESIKITFDDQVNLFIGPNGTGKSTIMRLLSWDFPNSGIPGYKQDGWSAPIKGRWPRNPDGSTNFRAVPQAYFPPVRVGMPISFSTRVRQTDSRIDDPWDNIISASPWNFFDGSRVYHAMQKLYRESLYGLNNRTRAAAVAYAAHRCVKDICDEVIASSIPKNIRTYESLQGQASDPGSDLPAELLNQPIEHYAMGVDTDEGSDETLYVGELSTGTQGVFLWVYYLTLTLARTYNFADEWQNQAGIVFIDEVENHLHPTWQRRVLPALARHFPGLQIFASTHSPFVVAGLKRGQVHKLYKENGIIKTPDLTVEERAQQIVGWTIEEILREFMDVDDPTDESTANAAATLRWLRYQRPGSEDAETWKQQKTSMLQSLEYPGRDELAALKWLQSHTIVRGDAEQWWNTKMDELRATVRRDFLAGGPIAAQRELFLEQLQELLRDDEADSQEGVQEG